MKRTLITERSPNSVINFAERPGVDFYISATEIGRGASCIVYHAVGSDNTEHLLKEYYPKHLDLDRDSSGQIVVPANKADAYNQGLVRFQNGCERQKAIRLSNKGLKNFTCNIQGYYRTNGTEYIDMTCFSGHTYDQVQEKSVYDLMLRMRTLAQVVENYHNAGLLHLDIKPENIYVRPESETLEDVILFDFDSVTPMTEIGTAKALSCTKTWAAPEQLLPEKRKSICPATDLFAIGEIIFVQLFGRHSTNAERRSFVTKYDYNHKAPIFKDINPKVFPLLDDLLCHTICGVVGERYKSAGEMIAKLDEIIEIADPKAPFLKKTIPYVKDPFVGREKELGSIHRLLSAQSMVFLSGIGGIGKSELAKQYAKKYSDYYDTITLISFAESLSNTIQAAENCPYNVKQSRNEKPEDYFQHKVEELQKISTPNTLIILDNFDVENDPNIDVLFSLGAKILITTRSDFSDIYSQLVVAALEKPFEVFCKHYHKSLSESELVAVNEIIDIVCGHTLTVELLAKQMMAGRLKPDKMLAKVKEGGISNSGHEKVRHTNRENNNLVTRSTYEHIKALFDISGLDEDDLHILADLSLVPYSGISTELFYSWCELDDYDCINQLVAEGWIRQEKDKDYISVHPLISEIVLDSIKDTSMFKKFIKAYISHLRERNSSDITNPRDHCEDGKIDVHFLNLIERYRFSAPFFEILLNEIGGNLFTIHQYDLALRACELATQIALKNNPVQSYAVTESMSQTALIKASIGAERRDFAAIREAIDTYLQAIENHKTFDENEYPDNYEEIATLYNYTGMAYEDLDEIENARDMYRKGIKVYTQRSLLTSDDYISLGILYNNLGNTYSGSKALEYYLAAKDNHERSGSLTRHAATTLYHLADIYSYVDSGKKDLDLAVSCAQKALAFFLNEYSEDLYMIGEAKYMLGKVYSQFGDTESNQAACALLNDAEKIFVQFLPPEDNTVVKTRQLIRKVAQN